MNKIKDDLVNTYDKQSEVENVDEKNPGINNEGIVGERKKILGLKPSKRTEIFTEVVLADHHYEACYDSCKEICEKNNIYFDLKEENDNGAFLYQYAALFSKIMIEEFVNKRPGYKKKMK